MFKTTEQNKISSLLDNLTQLLASIENKAVQRYYDNLTPLFDVSEIRADFEGYDLEPDGLAKEVENNFYALNRDAQEFHYLQQLNSFLAASDFVLQRISAINWPLQFKELVKELVSQLPLDSEELDELLSGSIFITVKELIHFGNLFIPEICVNVEVILLNAKQSARRSYVFLSQPSAFPHIADGLAIDPAPTVQDTEVKLKWREENGDKTDLAELIWALAKSRRIINASTGKPATISELARQLGAMFDTTINVTGLMQGRKDSYLAKDDGLTFTSLLFDLVDGYVTKSANSL